MLGQSGIIKLIVCGILIFGISVIALNIVSYNRHTEKRSVNFKITENNKKSNDVLLLGGKISWQHLGTVRHLKDWGYRAITIDNPVNISNVINKFKLQNLVIISSPSSNRLTIPFIVNLKSRQNRIRGFVIMTPASTIEYKKEDFEKVQVPTLIIHGTNEKKKSSQITWKNLKRIPRKQIFIIKNATSIDKSIQFHNRLKTFLFQIYHSMNQTSA